MSNPVREAILQKKVEGVLHDLMIQTNAQNVVMNDGRTLAVYFADYLTSVQTANQIDERVSAIVGGAPEAYDTLKEIAEYIEHHEDVYAALQAAVGDKVSKEVGKGLSANDFTDTLKAKLEALSSYTHPATHSAAMIDEIPDRKFVTQAEKDKIAASGRILAGTTAPADLSENDLFLQIVG